MITHGHIDHFFPSDLGRKRKPYAFAMREPTITMICSQKIASNFDTTDKNIEIKLIKEFETLKLGSYEITALPARHMPGGEAFIYVIKEGDKTLLYGNDTGYFYDSVFEYIKNNKIVFDMISLDCTNIDLPIEDTSGHMGFPNLQRVICRLEKIGAITEDTLKYLNHFSHKGNPLQDALEEQAKPYGCLVAYDGCVVEI
jgi:phosphoribosyl 1,2-cyclic phosphate phosphodiesterase